MAESLAVSTSPILVDADGPLRVKNIGPQSVYYGPTSSVSSTNNTGSLASGASLTASAATYFVVSSSGWTTGDPNVDRERGAPRATLRVTPENTLSVRVASGQTSPALTVLDANGHSVYSISATGTPSSQSPVTGAFVVTAYGAVADGAPGDNKTCTGTNNYTAFQAAIDAAYTAGGGAVYVPPGTYRISNTVHVKRGVTVMGPAGGNGGAPRNGAQTDGEPWWDSVGRKFKVPQSALPTILQDGNVTVFNMDSPGSSLQNLAFLNPKQLLPDEYDNGGVRATEPTNFAATIACSGSNAIVLRNLVDYNSWDFISTFAQSGFVVEDIWSQCHNRIIYGTCNEFYFRRIHYNTGTVYYVGNNTHQGWNANEYLIDVLPGGPSIMSEISLVGADYGIRIRANWGITMSDVWLDQIFVEGIKLEHYGPGSPYNNPGQTILHKLTNIEAGAGNSAGIKCDLQYGSQTNGANMATVLVSNSVLCKLNLKGDFVFKGTNLAVTSLTTEGGGLEPLNVQFTNCSLPTGTRCTNVAGTTLMFLSGVAQHQGTAEDTITAGDLWVMDHDRMRTETITIPAATVLASGDNTVGELFVPADALGKRPQLVIWSVEGMARNGDAWKLGGTSGIAGTILAPLYNTIHASAAEQVPQAALNQGQPMAKTYGVGLAKVKMPSPGGSGGSTSVTKGYRVPVIYNAVGGYTVSGTDFPYGLKVRITYCSTP